MRRTYRSKKDVGGALDRDVLLNMDEKSSAFDAFYIQNIKQTKRELSCVGSSHYSTASNKVRKRKYVKRIVKDAEKVPDKSVHSDSVSHSVFLTPDKSIRVNKAFDAFDMLLNSTCTNSVAKKDRSCEKIPQVLSKPKTYVKKRKRKIKKMNYSSSTGTDSEKENSSEPQDTCNTTDIKNYKLTVEQETKTTPKEADESIYKIVNKMSIFNHLKQEDTDYLTPHDIEKHRLTINIQSPISQEPLSSTPFKEKYRSHSIYKFSPISTKMENNTPNFESIIEENNDSNNSIVFVGTTTITHNKKPSNKNETLHKHCNDESQVKTKDVHNNSWEINNPPNSFKNIENSKSIIEINSLQTTELEPFLGFPANVVTKPECDDLESTQNSTNVDNQNDFLVHNEKNKDSNSESINKVPNSDNSDSDTSNQDSSYDTCNSDEYSLTDKTQPIPQPKVLLEKMDDSTFLKYYEKLLINNLSDDDDDDDTSSYNSIESNEISKSFESNTYEESSQKSETTSNDSSNDANESDGQSTTVEINEEKVSFVTTRRRNDVTNEIMISMIDNDYKDSDSSGELDLTVLNADVFKNEDTSKAEDTIVESDTINNSNDFHSNEINEESEVTLYALPKLSNSNVSANIDDRKSITFRRKTRLSKKSKSKTPQKLEITVDNKMNPDVIEVTSSEEHGSESNTEINEEIITKRVSRLSRKQSRHDREISSESSDEDNEVNRNSRISRRSTIISHPDKTCRSYMKFDLTSENPLLDISKTTERNLEDSVVSTVATRNSRVSRRSEGISETDNTEVKPCIVLQPGKKWERSLSIYRRMTTVDNLERSVLDESLNTKGRKYRQSVISTMEMQENKGPLHNESIYSRRSTFVSKPSRSTISIVKDPNISRASLCVSTAFDDLKGFLSDDCDDTIVSLSKLSLADVGPEITVIGLHDTSHRLVTARDYVLRRCNQTDAILFDECYPDVLLKNCHKIGEGVYGEVFLWRARDGRARVMKVVPIAGHVKVNGEDQKDYHEIISEIVIAMELSALRAPIAEIERHFDEGNDETLDLHAIGNATDVFNEVLAVRCVYGSYPSRLLDLWDLYDECKGSENDNPAILPQEQQYIVLELANAGQDLESYQFNNAEQAHALFLQVAFGLAVGEEAFQFEHRDLHWGNVLIAPTEQKFATFILRGRRHTVGRCGVAATIIDYSLSRVSLPLEAPDEAAALYNDLAHDEGLFEAVGDYQFEVYRLMKRKLGNDWKNFEPYTNILWLHYTVDKMITALRYKRTNTKIHKHYIDKLKNIKNRILDYSSAVDFVLNDNEY